MSMAAIARHEMGNLLAASAFIRPFIETAIVHVWVNLHQTHWRGASCAQGGAGKPWMWRPFWLMRLV